MGCLKLNKVKALGSLVLVSALVAGSVFAYNKKTNVNADVAKEESFENIIPAMELFAKEYASDFASSIEKSQFSTDEVTPIVDINDELVGYSVALTKDNINYGYVNIDFNSENLVTDFSIEKDSRSIYTTLAESFDTSNKAIEADECEEKLYNTTGLDYAISAVDESTKIEVFYYDGITYESKDFEEMLDEYEENYLEYYDNIEYEDDFVYEVNLDNGEIIDENNEVENGEQIKTCKVGKAIAEKFKDWVEECYPKLYNKLFANDGFIAPTAYPDHNEVFKNETICTLDKEVYVDCYSKEDSLLSQEEVMKTTNRYACELVGITAICMQEGMKLNGTMKDTFNKLWDLAGCEGRIYETGTFYGDYVVDCSSTYTSHMPNVVKDYAKLFNKQVDAKYTSNPKFEVFKEGIDAGDSMSLGYSIKKEGGHGVNVVGYAQGKIGTHDIDYLITGDSWYDDSPRYVLYGRGMFQSVECNSFDITDKKDS